MITVEENKANKLVMEDVQMRKKRQDSKMLNKDRFVKSQEYQTVIIEMVREINDTSILIKIYTAVKTLAKGE